MSGWEGVPRDAKGQWTGGSGGGGGVGLARGSAVEQARREFAPIKDEHKALRGKLASGAISDDELNRLDSINKFVLKRSKQLGIG